MKELSRIERIEKTLMRLGRVASTIDLAREASEIEPCLEGLERIFGGEVKDYLQRQGDIEWMNRFPYYPSEGK